MRYIEMLEHRTVHSDRDGNEERRTVRQQNSSRGIVLLQFNARIIKINYLLWRRKFPENKKGPLSRSQKLVRHL